MEKTARREFEAARQLQDQDEVAFCMQLGEAQLDNARRQRVLLNQLQAEGNLKS